MNIPMMKCGHSANAENGKGYPACAICAPDPRAYQVDSNPPSLEGRKARCTYYGTPTRHNECNYGGERDAICHCEQPSSTKLPFFEYLGPDAPTRLCKYCGLTRHAHRLEDGACPLRYQGSMKPIPGSYAWQGKTFESRDYEFDEFYCGCHSWD